MKQILLFAHVSGHTELKQILLPMRQNGGKPRPLWIYWLGHRSTPCLYRSIKDGALTHLLSPADTLAGALTMGGTLRQTLAPVDI